MSNLPVFGCAEAGVTYTPRRAVYAVISDCRRSVAAVLGPGGKYWLPGGGCEPGESFEETVVREVREELGRMIQLLRPLGEAVQYFHGANKSRHYKMTANFFVAEFLDGPTIPSEHELIWLPPEVWERAFFHECHVWAAQRLHV